MRPALHRKGRTGIAPRVAVCLVAGLAVGVVAVALATNYYVDGTIGDNANDGFAPTIGGGHGPKKNINPTLAISATGDVINVAAGFYQETNWVPTGQELRLALGVVIYDTDPATTDSDGDGLMDAIEVSLGTDPFDADTDGDGLPDGIDASPTQADTTPPTFTVTYPTAGATIP